MSETTKSNDGSLGVTNEEQKRIEERINKAGYNGVTINAVDIAVSDKSLEINGENVGNATGSDDSSSSKKSKYIIAGTPFIMKFKDKIAAIVQGVAVKVKGKTKKKDREQEDSKDKEDQEKGE